MASNIAQQYIDFLTYFGNTQLHDYDNEIKSLFAPYVKKIVNSSLICKDRDQLLKQMNNLKKQYGIQEVRLLDIMHSKQPNTHVVHFEIMWGKENGTDVVTSTLTTDTNGMIEEINEMSSEKAS